jgi:hypothetical protein
LPTTPLQEGDLGEGFRSAFEISDEGKQDPPKLDLSGCGQFLAQSTRCRTALLYRSGDQSRSRDDVCTPDRSIDRCTLHGGDRRESRQDVVGCEATRLVDHKIDAEGTEYSSAPSYKDVNGGSLEADHPMARESRQTAESHWGRGAEGRGPALLGDGQRSVVHRDRGVVERPPTAGVQLGAHLIFGEARAMELSPSRDPVLVSEQVLQHSPTMSEPTPRRQRASTADICHSLAGL